MDDAAKKYDQAQVNRLLEIAREKGGIVAVCYEKGLIYHYDREGKIINSISIKMYLLPTPNP